MSRRIKHGFIYIFLIILCFFSLFPIMWMLVSATNTTVDILSGRLIPGTALLDNLSTVVNDYNLYGALWNSFRNASCLSLLSLIICSMAGYGFEIYRDRKKDIVMQIVLVGMMVPMISIVIPLYRMFSEVGMLNTMGACILPTISTPFLIFLFRQNSRSFPREIIQSARIDGLNEIQIFFRMYMPIMKPTYATALTITFMNAWNAYLWPNIVLLDNKEFTMPIMLAYLMTGYRMDYGAILLCVTCCTLPTIIIFLLLQKSFVNGVAGSVKG
ncbi:MAG TPA: carbohydrate ABC transporter permease [Candidatus Mediterraneibacter norfolkensis]|nr:carbohydrate ABC transporter permease [Candidatus Mediterraneibacter norfolkensis]